MKIDTNPKKIKEILTRGVDKIYPSIEELFKKLQSRKKLRIYCGYDPTGSHLHTGHLITILKLADFQSLGHQIIMLIGDFTAMIGDPSDKSEARKKLSRKEVLVNCKNYKKIANKFINFSGDNPAKLMYNSKWSDKLTFVDIIEITSNFTVQQMIVRDMFQERIKKEKPIYLHEFLYPIAQAYDSVAMNVNIEIGGSDQLFNMLCGRDLMKTIRKKEKFVLSTKLLVDPSGKKMGKTEGNMVKLDDSPKEIYGKIMSWPDELIIPTFEICTRFPLEKIEKMKKEINSGKLNPIEAKILLAKEITSMCHGKEKAEMAQKEFERIFKEKKIPTKLPEIKINEKNLSILDLLIKTKLAPSKSEAKRLIIQKGIKIDNKVFQDWKGVVETKKGLIIQKGKREFVRII